MKIAITADNHLTTRKKHPERFHALEDIYRQCAAEKVQLLIIAGDLFDHSMANYHEFEELHRELRPSDLMTVIIPGNHDQDLNQESLLGEGLIVFAEPTIQPLNDSRRILFLPYAPNQTMGEIIARYHHEVENQRWILVSHGDWLSGRTTPDPYEPGVYMPLSQKDIQLFQPELVLLGHIHLPQSHSKVHYPGSPCPLNISETGIRQFLVLDTEKGSVASLPIDSQILYFDELFTIHPGENGLDTLVKDVKQRVKAWGVPTGWEKKVQVRTAIIGVSGLDRQLIADQVSKVLSPFSFYQDSGPDLSRLIYSSDPDRTEIADRFKIWIENLDWASTRAESPSKQQILTEAFRILYDID